VVATPVLHVSYEVHHHAAVEDAQDEGREAGDEGQPRQQERKQELDPEDDQRRPQQRPRLVAVDLEWTISPPFVVDLVRSSGWGG
jgi:hypothetical protein